MHDYNCGPCMPSDSVASWILLIDPTTVEAKPIYMEPNMAVFPFEVTVSAVSVPCS